MDDIISSAQLGFVPGRNITEATRLIKLAMALAEEEDEEGIMIAADWEKAFDRVSWEYLHDALRELGFGPRLREWVGTIYNSYSPPIRRVKANGERSPPFEVHSGTPQGCPASPLIFLLVAEALTRAVESDEHLRGVTVGGREVRISQFADDTQFLLRGYDQLQRMWAHIQQYEDSTGMKANQKKFEGLRMGRTKKAEVPSTPHTNPINWVQDGKYIRVLGVPFWEKYDVEEFWLALYRKTKVILASWRATTRA
jgi:hypothetical protein